MRVQAHLGWLAFHIKKTGSCSLKPENSSALRTSNHKPICYAGRRVDKGLMAPLFTLLKGCGNVVMSIIVNKIVI